MSQETILGGSGVTWGDEKVKINANFTELYAHTADPSAHGDGLPSQTGYSGYFLKTDGSSASWTAIRQRLTWTVVGT